MNVYFFSCSANPLGLGGEGSATFEVPPNFRNELKLLLIFCYMYEPV